MIRSKNLFATLAVLGGLGLAALAAPAARAGMIPNKVTVTPSGDGNYIWTYNVVVTSDVYVQPGDYFTIYDFPDASAVGSTAPAGWTLSISDLGTTPSLTNPTDDPNVPNLTWTYTGATTIFGQQEVGSFTVVSPWNNVAESSFTTATHRQDNDNPEYTITTTSVAVDPSVPVNTDGGKTPEPATLVLALAGLPVVALVRLRRKG